MTVSGVDDNLIAPERTVEYSFAAVHEQRLRGMAAADSVVDAAVAAVQSAIPVRSCRGTTARGCRG